MKLAILGTRGVPPNYGGFETFAAELSTRLVRRGHQVSVYCRETGAPVWNGVQRIVLPAAGHKYLETVSHAFLSAVDALRRDFDAILVCNAANAFVLPLLRAAGIPVAINVDGIERKRRKWNVLGRAVYAAGEALSVSFANAVIADAEVIAEYYREHYAASPVVIPYGAEFPDEEDSDVLPRLGVRPGEYILYVSRFEPENNPLEVVLAYEKAMGPMGQMGPVGSHPPNPQSSILNPQSPISPSALGPQPSALLPLIMLGKGLYAKDLVETLHRHASNQIRFPGALYDRDYRTLQRNALIYIQATEVGGTHPALIEAMASGGRVLAHDTSENREVGGDAVGYFQLRPAETLSGMLREWLSEPQTREDYRLRARRRAAGRYSWENVTDAYESLFEAISGAR
ncbi:MAG TPA: glycosyltransferase [Thermoanaerobaculia bacterium]|nr:glycosyltransferase [Thermoanaerobaculia bacterium]